MAQSKNHTKTPMKSAAAKTPDRAGKKRKPKGQSTLKAATKNSAVKAAIESDRDFKAHIYQQLVDLQPFLAEDSQISVAMQVEKDPEHPEEKPECVLTLHTNVGQFQLETEGRDKDQYRALEIAKQKMVQQLNEVHAAAIDTRERNAHIQALARGELTLH